MNKFALLLILITGTVLCAFAQSPLGFADTWLLDEKASFSREVDRKAFDKFVLEISDDDEAFTIKVNYTMDKRPLAYDIKLFKDGRGEENKVAGRFSVLSRTKVKDREIVRTYKQGGNPGSQGVDKFTLSKDGNKLMRVRRQVFEDPFNLRNTPGVSEHLAPELPTTLVFRRKT
jgi:hypothetical protein